MSATLSLTARVELAEAKTTIELLDTMERLCELTRVEQCGVNLTRDSVTRQFEANMMLTMISARAGDEQLNIYGYGDHARVLNFGNVVGILLESDLEELERVLSTTARLPLRSIAALDEALSQFLQSEINSTIGRGAGSLNAPKGDLVSRQLSRAVSGAYVQRAGKASRTAVTRIYCSEIVRPAALATTATALTAIVVPILNYAWLGWTGWAALIIAVCGGASAEYVGLASVKRRFSQDLASKAIVLLRATQTLWLWRLAMAGGMIATILAVAMLWGSLHR